MTEQDRRPRRQTLSRQGRGTHSASLQTHSGHREKAIDCESMRDVGRACERWLRENDPAWRAGEGKWSSNDFFFGSHPNNTDT